MTPKRTSLTSLAALSGVALIGAYWVVGFSQLDGFRLDLGSVNAPTPRWLLMAALMLALGSPAAVCLGAGLALALRGPPLAQLRSWWTSRTDRQTLWFAVLLGALLPMAIQASVLGYSPVTDDEASYLFQAQLLASGRLVAPSPAWKVFYDNVFLINDGHIYSAYFLGWPAVLALGVKLGAPSLVAPLLSGAIAAALFLSARELWSANWGRVAVALYLSSGFLMTTAATGMSHTVTLCGLAWLFYAWARLERAGGPTWVSALGAFGFALAFWSRPAAALGLGGPLLLGLVLAGWRQSARWRHWGAVALVGAPLAALFLAANDAMHGSPFSTGYHAAARYAEDNGFRFNFIKAKDVAGDTWWYFFTERDPLDIAARYAFAALRLAIDGMGWPVGLLPLLLARGPVVRWLGAGTVGFCLLHLAVRDSGIDSFGPVHFTELMLVVVVLGTSAFRTLWAWTTQRGLDAVAPATALALTLTAWTTQVPTRLHTLALIAMDVRAPREAAEEAPGRAVIFSPPRLGISCHARPARNYVFFRPNSDPDQRDRLLWVNHLSLERDRQFVERVNHGPGFLLTRGEGCSFKLVPLEQATPDRFPTIQPELPGDFEGD